MFEAAVVRKRTLVLSSRIEFDGIVPVAQCVGNVL
jgi:hypothetical protein